MNTRRVLPLLIALLAAAPACEVAAYPSSYGYGGYDYYGYGPPVTVGASVSLGTFQATLAPYGTWYTDPIYGSIWVPSPAAVGATFAPYSCGRWFLSSYGWTWDSCYPWGWAPFHYGRWLYRPAVGWAWIPGTQWAPAWVSWRYGGGYVGWAPLGPAGNVAHHPDGAYWHFAPATVLTAPNVASARRVPPAVGFAVTAPVQHPVVVNRVPYNYGPPPAAVSHAVGRPITPVPPSQMPPHVAPPMAARPMPPGMVPARPVGPAYPPGPRPAPPMGTPRPAAPAPVGPRPVPPPAAPRPGTLPPRHP